LNKVAQSGFYIRDGKTLERLAKVDTLLISSKSFESGKLPTLLKSDLLNLDLCIVIYKPVENLQNWIDRLEIPDVNLYDLSTTEELDTIIQSLKERGKNVAWLEDSLLEPTKADIVITNQGSDIALRQKNDLRCIVDTLNLADETMSTIYQSLAMTTSLNVTAVFMGVALGIDPIYTVSVNAGAAIVGELNSLRLHQ
jgi:cation transport ATPase